MLASGQLFQADMATFFGIPVDQLRSGWIEVRHQNEELISVVGSISLWRQPGRCVQRFPAPAIRPQADSSLLARSRWNFRDDYLVHGLATLNTSERDANVSVTVRDPGGVVTANGGYLLKAGERVSKTLPRSCRFRPPGRGDPSK